MARFEGRRATREDAPEVLATITLAFMADAAARFLYPRPNDYLNHFPKFVEGFGGRAFENSGAYYLDGHVGAALWLPPGVHSDDDGLDDLLARTLNEDHRQTLNDVLGQMANYHPKEPHWHLAMIGVDPLEQHRGYGSALLEVGLIPCDEARETAYLESTNPRNIPLYERFGFEVMGTIDLGKCPPIYPMVRRPRS
jgi:ribosomal protein S18 acetylase RimI-like enzyme